jgi:DNA-binding NarL/FixJ family response regulator
MIEYYKFAAFIFALIVAAVVVARLAFGGVKRRLKELDEREAALLKLYRDIEKLSDTFSAEAEDALDLLRETEERIYARKAAPADSVHFDAEPAPPEPPLVGQMQIPEVSDATSDNVPTDKTRHSSRRETVLSLAKDGLATDDIARALSITQNEVALIIGLLADNK